MLLPLPLLVLAFAVGRAGGRRQGGGEDGAEAPSDQPPSAREKNNNNNKRLIREVHGGATLAASGQYGSDVVMRVATQHKHAPPVDGGGAALADLVVTPVRRSRRTCSGAATSGGVRVVSSPASKAIVFEARSVAQL